MLITQVNTFYAVDKNAVLGHVLQGLHAKPYTPRSYECLTGVCKLYHSRCKRTELLTQAWGENLLWYNYNFSKVTLQSSVDHLVAISTDMEFKNWKQLCDFSVVYTEKLLNYYDVAIRKYVYNNE